MYAAATNMLKPTYQHPIHQYINILQHKVCYNIFQTDQSCNRIYSFLNLLYNHVHVNEGNKCYFILSIYLFSELCRTLSLPLEPSRTPMLSHTLALYEPCCTSTETSVLCCTMYNVHCAILCSDIFGKIMTYSNTFLLQCKEGGSLYWIFI